MMKMRCAFYMGMILFTFGMNSQSWAETSDRIFLGFDPGYSTLSASGSERSKNGFQLAGKIYGSRTFDQWLLDVGLGWFYNSLSNTQSTGTIKVTTNAGFLEISPRFHIGTGWQVGPIIQGLLGSDVTFSESRGAGNSFAANIGLGIRRETGWNDHFLHYGIRGVTDLSIAGRQVSWICAELGIGFLWDKKESASAPVLSPAVQTSSPVVTKGPAEVIADQAVKVTLDERSIHFKTNKSDLNSDSQKVLSRISEFLLARLDSWEQMRVEGHTDSRGKVKHNIKLSYDRATSVARFMVEKGIEGKRVTVKGHGSSQPIDSNENEEAWKLNRRVELRIEGVKDAIQFADGFNKIWEEPSP